MVDDVSLPENPINGAPELDEMANMFPPIVDEPFGVVEVGQCNLRQRLIGAVGEGTRRSFPFWSTVMCSSTP